MGWEIKVSNNIKKQIKKLPEKIMDAFLALLVEIKVYGPVRGNWKNYGKLSKTSLSFKKR